MPAASMPRSHSRVPTRGKEKVLRVLGKCADEQVPFGREYASSIYRFLFFDLGGFAFLFIWFNLL
jgi:hypothetical protein